MQVYALQTGFYGGVRHRKGAVFEVPSGTKARWFAPLSSHEAAPKKAAREAPKALSEIGKSQPKSFVEAMGQDPGGNIAPPAIDA